MNFFTELLHSFHPSADGFVFMWAIIAIGCFAVFLVIERWLYISARSDIDAPRFVQKIRNLLLENQDEQAIQLCKSGGKLILPKVVGNAIVKSKSQPALIRSGVEQDVVGAIAGLERRLSFLSLCSNVSTLLGLMGTIYGLILAFEAVGQPNVSPAMKTSMLASGISTAMNTTLLGLIAAVPCIFAYSAYRAKIDRVIAELDEYSIGIMKYLVPSGTIQKSYRPSSRKSGEAIESEPNIVPMMSLMTVLIPLLLSSTEFVKLGNLQINLPAGGGGGDMENMVKKRDLTLGVIITKKGIDVKSDLESSMNSFRTGGKDEPAILKKGKEHDFAALNRYFIELKRKALYEILKPYRISGISPSSSLPDLYKQYNRINKEELPTYTDHESVKIVAENNIKYQIIVSVMDAARSGKTKMGKVPLFPNVSLAGGIF